MKTLRKTMTTMMTAAVLTTLAGVAQAFPPGAGPGSGFGGGPCATGAGPGAGMGYGRGYGPGPGAGGPGMRGYGPGPAAAVPGNPAANVEARLNGVKSALGITPDQQAAWETFAARAKERAATMQTMRGQLATAPAQTTDEHFAQRANFAKQRAATMESMSTAVKELYAVLTPEQKALADRQFGRGPGAGQGPRAGGQGPGYGPGAGGQGPGYGPGAGRGYGPRW